MSDVLKSAIEEMELQLQEHMQEAAELKRTINVLCRRVNEPERYPDVDAETHASKHLRRDQFFGKPLATAAREYLEMKHEACDAESIIAGLESGGFDFSALGWKEEGQLRSFTMSLAKNTAVFVRLPSGAFGLKAWYPNLPKAKLSTKAAIEKVVSGAPAADVIDDLTIEDIDDLLGEEEEKGG